MPSSSVYNISPWYCLLTRHHTYGIVMRTPGERMCMRYCSLARTGIKVIEWRAWPEEAMHVKFCGGQESMNQWQEVALNKSPVIAHIKASKLTLILHVGVPSRPCAVHVCANDAASGLGLVLCSQALLMSWRWVHPTQHDFLPLPCPFISLPEAFQSGLVS